MTPPYDRDRLLEWMTARGLAATTAMAQGEFRRFLEFLERQPIVVDFADPEVGPRRIA